MNPADPNTKALTGVKFWTLNGYTMFKPNGETFHLQKDSSTREE